MKPLLKLAVGSATAVALATTLSSAAGAVGSRDRGHWGGPGVVFVQTDNLSGNQVVAYDRAPNGTLTQASVTDTGGLGGAQNGSVVDHLASQGGLAADPDAGALLAVNAGSDTISVLGVHGDHLWLRQVLSSGGSFPSSIATFGDLVYVLNAEDGGSVVGFRFDHGWLHELPGSTRSLGLTTPTDATQFTHTPGQVAFAPDGRQLLVTTKATTSAIDVFWVHPFGWLSASPTVNVEAGAVPFALTFDPAGHVVVANAGTDSVSTYALGWNGTLSPIANAATGEVATCWITSVRGAVYASNAGSGSVSGYATSWSGALTSIGQTSTDAGTVDSAATPDGRFLYVQTGAAGNVDGFAVTSGGSLSAIGSVTVPGAVGGEGIVAW